MASQACNVAEGSFTTACAVFRTSAEIFMPSLAQEAARAVPTSPVAPEMTTAEGVPIRGAPRPIWPR